MSDNSIALGLCREEMSGKEGMFEDSCVPPEK